MKDRIKREKKTVEMMVHIYCHRKHHSPKGNLCDECAELLRYSLKRVEACPKGKLKSSCRKCTTHCYAPAKRQQIREVMRFVGPRMLFLNPVAAIRHLLTELK